jgi:RNA polymerase sigma factor (TIGR02999 family)
VSDDPDDLPALVERWTGGDREAFNRLSELLYDDLRAIAHRHLQAERPDHTLTTTALVHEAYMELSGRTGPEWRGRAQFFALLSKVMRNVLVDYARRRKADKRGGSDVRVPLDENTAGADAGVFELLSVNQALEQLEARDAYLAKVVECRFFGGMPEAEIADALGVSTRTVERAWRRARSYLFTLLSAREACSVKLPPEDP